MNRDEIARPMFKAGAVLPPLMLLLTACAPAPALQAAAPLIAVEESSAVAGIPTAQVLGTMKPLLDWRMASGDIVRVWTFAARLGECSGSGSVDEEALTCPREALLVSVYRDLGGASQSGLWFASPRPWWWLSPAARSVREASSPDGSSLSVDLRACEASGEVAAGRRPATPNDMLHAVTYRLNVSSREGPHLLRLPDENLWYSCRTELPIPRP